MMWMDREVEEHHVYDHFSSLPSTNNANNPAGIQQLTHTHPNGTVNINGGIYAQLQQPQQHSSTPTTTNSMGMESSLGGDGSPPPMTLELDHDGPLHQHATLPAVDHRLPMDNHHLEDSQDIYGQTVHHQNLYHQPHHLIDPSGNHIHQQPMLVSSSSSCLGGTYGDHETTMMMQSPNGDSELLAGNLNYRSPPMSAHLHNPVSEEHSKLTSSKAAHKDRKNYLQIYARQFGLNDRGCYVALGLAALAFLLLVIIITMGATWPGKHAIFIIFVVKYRNSQKHESTLLHTYVLNEFLTADRSCTTKYF